MDNTIILLLCGFALSIVASIFVSFFAWLIPYHIMRPKVKIVPGRPTLKEKDDEEYLSIPFDVINQSKRHKKEIYAAYNIIAYLELWNKKEEEAKIVKVMMEKRAVLSGKDKTSIMLLTKAQTLHANNVDNFSLYLSFENKYGAKFLSDKIESSIVMQQNKNSNKDESFVSDATNNIEQGCFS